MAKPLVIVMAGCNGAGKSTAAAFLIPKLMPYLNADEIAKGLSDYPSRSADIEASRIMLSQMADLEEKRAGFAIETTLASRSLSPRLIRLRQLGYEFRLAFAFLPSTEMAVARVAGRVRLGGHNIPEETIRRRYAAGVRNFFELYRPIADRWFVFDTTRPFPLPILAEGQTDRVSQSRVSPAWNLMQAKGNS